MKYNPYIGYQRKFLNKNTYGETAAIVAGVENPTKSNGVTHSRVCASLQITDCNNKVYLDFNTSPLKEEDGRFDQSFDNCIFKVDTLIETLVQFKNDLFVARNTVIENHKPVEPDANGEFGKCHGCCHD